MFDARLRGMIDPLLDRLGRGLARRGVSADGVTAFGLILGLAAAAAIAFGLFWLALALIVLNRVADGLDGAVARATRKTDRGGFLDIVFDFFFYGAVPLAFAVYDPMGNGLSAAVLLFAFYANGASFLAFSIMAEKRGMETSARGSKSLYFTGGLAEGAETIAVFVVMCLVPAWFAPIAYGFAAVCAVTTLSRVVLAWQVFGEEAS